MNRATAVVGVLTVFAGLAVVYGGPVAGLELDYGFVTLVGVLAVVQGLRYGLERRSTTFEFTETGDPELRYHVPVPGTDHDESIARTEGWGYLHRRRRFELREDLQETAVETISIRESCSADAARARVEDGTWTDDPVAAAFLSPDAPEPPLTERVRPFFAREPAYSYRVRRTVRAIARLQEVAA